MPLTFEQLVVAPTRQQLLNQMVLALQGVGFTSHTGFSPGTVTSSGNVLQTYYAQAKVVTAGSLGSAQVQLSSDGGVTWGSTTTVPGSGLLALGSTGATLVFTNGPVGANSFVLGDVFSLELDPSNVPVTSWQPGSTPLTLLEVFAEALANFGLVVQADAAGGITGYSVGDWLDLLGVENYNIARLQGSTTVGNVLFSAASGAGPYTVVAGGAWVLSTSGKRFVNNAGFTIPLGGSVSVSVTAERPGTAYNVANSSITSLVTSLAGVSVSNTPGSGSWVTTQGADPESDAAYATRMTARWPALANAAVSPSAVLDLWARTASTEVVTTYIRASLTVAGQTEVWLAGSAGGVSGAAVTAVSLYITPRMGITETVLVQSATALPYTITATIYVAAAYLASATLQCAANLNAYNATVGVAGTVWVSDIIEQLSTPVGVRNVVVTAPAVDVVAGATQVPVPTQALTFVSV